MGVDDERWNMLVIVVTVVFRRPIGGKRGRPAVGMALVVIAVVIIFRQA